MVSREYGLEISTKKTKVMVASKVKINVRVTCNGATVEQVEQFRYLGRIITETGHCSKLRNHSQAWHCQIRYGVIKLPVGVTQGSERVTKRRLLQNPVWPVATYGSESWTLKATEKKRLEAFAMSRTVQESLADAKVSARQQCVYEDP